MDGYERLIGEAVAIRELAERLQDNLDDKLIEFRCRIDSIIEYLDNSKKVCEKK